MQTVQDGRTPPLQVAWFEPAHHIVEFVAPWFAKRAPEFMTKPNLDPRRFAGLDTIMADAVAFKYIPAPLTDAQVKEVLLIPWK